METMKKGLEKKGISYKEDIDINREPMIFILTYLNLVIYIIYIIRFTLLPLLIIITCYILLSYLYHNHI